MSEYVELLIHKFDPSSLMLLLVLWGVWKVAEKSMDKFTVHADKVSDSLEKIADDCHEMRKDLAVVVARVDTHESRINRLEELK